MNLKKISFGNFKSLYNASFEPGKVNVFIGAMHPQSPSVFAVDCFDHALNPRLAKKMIEVFCEQIIKNDKHVFLTTHNPLVLDGLDLTNDEIRLFSVDRDINGHAQINRIMVSQELINEGQSLSRLWINGRLGGVPNLL